MVKRHTSVNETVEGGRLEGGWGVRMGFIGKRFSEDTTDGGTGEKAVAKRFLAHRDDEWKRDTTKDQTSGGGGDECKKWW